VTASASGSAMDAASVTEAPARHRNDWRVLLALFIIAGIVESQAFGHLSAFTPIYLDTLGVPPEQISTWTGILSALAFVIWLPLLPLWGVGRPLSQSEPRATAPQRCRTLPLSTVPHTTPTLARTSTALCQSP
jgi:hypothetical protein